MAEAEEDVSTAINMATIDLLMSLPTGSEGTPWRGRNYRFHNISRVLDRPKYLSSQAKDLRIYSKTDSEDWYYIKTTTMKKVPKGKEMDVISGKGVKFC